jgi:hypothetical protein
LKIFNSDGTKKTRPVTIREGSTVKFGTHDYHIFAVVTHAGASLMSGHYISYVEQNAVWVCFNDEKITRNKQWQTDSCQQGNETPYIFFLRRIKDRAQAPFPVQIEAGCASQQNEVDIAATVSNEIGETTEPACRSQQNDVQQSGSITVGNNVLARMEQNVEWEMAILTECQRDKYQVYLVERKKTLYVTGQNIKPLDWQYWKHQFRSWTCTDFNKALVEWKTPKNWITEGLKAFEDCQIGTVVAHHSGCNDNLNVAGLKSSDDFNCEIVCVRNQDMTCKDTNGGPNEKCSVAAFLVTTKPVHKGQQLTWCERDVDAAVDKDFFSSLHAADPKPKGAAEDEARDVIPIGRNVLAQLKEGGNWTLAIVMKSTESFCLVHIFSMAKTQSISRRHIKILDWNYWKEQMELWTYANFKDALAQWNTQVGAKSYRGMGRGLVALEDCQVGTVVAEYSGYIADTDGSLYMGGYYPAMDECMRKHASVRVMQDADWKIRKHHSLSLGSRLSARFCIDGYATTCPTLDGLQDHGEVGWGALLNSYKKSKCNCTLLWVRRPDIRHVDKLEHLDTNDCIAAFLVTNKNVTKGDQLTWTYKAQSFYFDSDPSSDLT